MPKYCAYCGKPVKKNDNFCIACGKPLLSKLPKKEKTEEITISDSKKEAKIEKKKKKKELEEEKPEESQEIESEEENVDKKEKEEEKEEEIVEEIKPLPEDVKEQIEIHLELKDIQDKKQNLAEKLKDLQKLVNSPQYESDFEFGEKINVQLQAVKTLISEVKQRENELNQKISGKFIVDKLNTDIEVKRNQLKNLVREFKLKKIRDKDVVKKLKKKYKNQLEAFTEQKVELIAGITLWIEELNEKKAELTTEKNFNKARYASKEIAEEEYKTKDQDFEKQIDRVSKIIDRLTKLTK